MKISFKSKTEGHPIPKKGGIPGYWNKGQQARVLRAFLKGIGGRPVKFHALRACFATQLLAKNIPHTVVMKICGWKNLKTMEFYVRLPGVNEAGATEVLNILPSDREVMDNVSFKLHKLF